MPSKHVRSLRALFWPALALLTALGVLSGGALSAQTPISIASCPFAGGGNTYLTNGFYVASYPGNNLFQVTLGYTSTYAQPYAITLTAHRNTYDGPIIGTPQTAVINVPTSGEALATFDFGGAPVTPGDTIAFTQTFAIYGSVGALVTYDGGVEKCNGIIQTTGTVPPLGSPTTSSVGVAITELDLRGRLCIPSDTVLCLDGSPGDHRFQVTVSYHTAQAGGRSGSGQAIPLAPLGVIHGGLFWFFSPDNPEMVVKILDGCAIDDHYWAYISAATNVGFAVTVTDTARANVSKTYTNPDLTMALPIQDTSALASCHDCTSDAECPTGLLCCSIPVGRHACIAPTTGGVCPLLP
jgi:hypothetical protein